MEFQKPFIFYFFLSLLVPIIIHLFRFRRHQKIKFSNTTLLKQLNSQYKSQKNIQRIVVLLNRLIILSLLIIAFALPLIKNKTNSNPPEKIGIYIDNSFSMNLTDENQKRLIDSAKENAHKIISNLSVNQKVMIITNEFSKKNQRWYSPNIAINMIDSITVSGFTKSIPTILNRYHQNINDQESNKLYLFSDFQKIDSKSIENISSNTEINIGILEGSTTPNISIDSCYFTTPLRKNGAMETLRITLTNHSNQDILTNIKLNVNNQQKSNYQLEVSKYSTIEEDLSFTNYIDKKNVSGSINIQNDNIQFDNTLFFSYPIQQKIKILNIHDSQINYYLNNIFSDSLFDFTHFHVNQIQYNLLTQYDLIILDHIEHLQNSLINTIIKYIESGGNVFVFPKKNADIHSYNELFLKTNTDQIDQYNIRNQTIHKINYKHKIFNSVFEKQQKNISLPKIQSYFSINPNPNRNRLDILSFMNGNPFLAQYNYKKGSIIVCYSDLYEDTSFALHALFVPCLYNAAIMQVKNNPLYHMITSNLIINQKHTTTENIFTLKQGLNFEFIPSIIHNNQNTLLNFKNVIRKSGHYNLNTKDSTINILSFNYKRIESIPVFLNKKDISNFFINNNYNFMPLKNNNVVEKNSDKNQNKPFSNTLIILALLAILTEIILLKIWRI